MFRTTYYSQEQLRSFDLLWAERDAMQALGGLAVSLAGNTNGVLAGLAATATGPATLTLNLAKGWIYQQATVDPTTWGALAADATIIQQQGFIDAQQLVLTTAALSAGQSQWALVEAQFGVVDAIRTGDPTGGVLNYYNSANPSQPLQGPGNNGLPNNTVRKGVVTVHVVYGAPAATGSEVPPQPTAGWLPMYLIDLAFGQTAVAQNQILVTGPSVGTGVPSNYTYAPFLGGLLGQHHLGNGNGQGPKIDLTKEVANTLPLGNLPTSNTAGGGVPVMKLFAGNPNGNVAGNANVNGASDMAFDTLNNILYVCITTGTTVTAVWSAVVGQTGQLFSGGTTTGSANAQVSAATTPAGYSKTPGQLVTFTAGFTNTASMTYTVAATGASTVQKNTGGGNVNLAAGDIVAGSFYTVIWTGTVYLLQASALGQLATLNIGALLKNDGAGNLTIKTSASVAIDGSGNLATQATAVTPGTYTRTKLTVAADGRLTAASSGLTPTNTALLSGTGLYTTPANCTRLKIRMLGGGGGGGGISGGATAGGNGTQSNFGTTTALPGVGGGINGGSSGGSGGTGGTGGATGTGTAIIRIAGGAGEAGWNTSGVLVTCKGGCGAYGPFGGAGLSTNSVAGAAVPNTGAGGGGATSASSSVGGGGGGGCGEYVEFFVTSPAATYNYTVGAAGAAGGGTGAGGAGGSGIIIVEEFYD